MVLDDFHCTLHVEVIGGKNPETLKGKTKFDSCNMQQDLQLDSFNREISEITIL